MLRLILELELLAEELYFFYKKPHILEHGMFAVALRFFLLWLNAHCWNMIFINTNGLRTQA